MTHMSSPDQCSRLRRMDRVPAKPVRHATGTTPSRADCVEQDRTPFFGFLLLTSASTILSALAITLGQFL